MIPTILNFVFPFVFFGCWDVGKRWLKFQHGSHGILFYFYFYMLNINVSVFTRSFLPAPVNGGPTFLNLYLFVWVYCHSGNLLGAVFQQMGNDSLVGAIFASHWPNCFQEKYDWDDYSHWLAISKHLISTGDFITLNNFNINNAQPAYPAGLAVLISLVHFDLMLLTKICGFTTNVFIFLF